MSRKHEKVLPPELPEGLRYRVRDPFVFSPPATVVDIVEANGTVRGTGYESGEPSQPKVVRAAKQAYEDFTERRRRNSVREKWARWDGTE